MDTAGTTTWYAFHDPDSNREYFHEPISGKTTWVLPTSSSTHIERAEKHIHGPSTDVIKAPKSEKMKRQHEGVDSQISHHDKQKHSRGWGVVGVTIVSILFFNTLFILVLVKALYDNSNKPNQIIEQIKKGDVPIRGHENIIKHKVQGSDHVNVVAAIHEEDIISNENPDSLLEDALSSNAQLGNETQNCQEENEDGVEGQMKQNSRVGGVEEQLNRTEDSSCVEDPEVLCLNDYSSNAAEESEDVYHSEPEVTAQEGIDLNKARGEVENKPKSYKSINQEASAIETRDGGQASLEAEESVEKDNLDRKGNEVYNQSHQIIQLSRNVPWICWIPFSYILFEQCGHRVREGLPMPLADIDNTFWI